MKEALVAISRRGQFKQRISSLDIKSREHARKLYPLVTPEVPHQLVTYVRPSFDPETNRVTKRSYFARLPRGKKKSVLKQIKEEGALWHSQRSESVEHLTAKNLIARELERRMQVSKSLIWCFADESRSDFPLKGDLLLGATSIRTEYPLYTPFDEHYKLDIAVLGRAFNGQEIVLAGIEIELTHSFDGYKGLLSKTLGFPMISVDITDLDLEALTTKWAADILESTTLTTRDGLRKTYFYLHDLIYPQFISYPEGFFKDKYRKHHYLIFAGDEDIARLDSHFKTLAANLNYPPHDVVVGRITDKSDQSRLELQNLGNIVGPDWKTINAKQCLRVAVQRPTGIDDLRAHAFHSVLAKTLLAERNALVGYKYMQTINNDDLEDDIWVKTDWPNRDIHHRILPKRLADPMQNILDLIGCLQVALEE